MTQDQTSSILPGRAAGTVERTRSDNGEEALLVAYRNLQAPGAPSPWFGDDDGPFLWPQGAMTVDGTTGITPQTVPGKPQKIAVDPWGRLWVRPAPQQASATTSATGETEHSVVPSPAAPVVVTEYAGLNENNATAYLMVFDSATLPANGTVPRFTSLPVTTGQFGSIELDERGVVFENGVWVMFSSTPLVLTKSLGLSSFTIVYG